MKRVIRVAGIGMLVFTSLILILALTLASTALFLPERHLKSLAEYAGKRLTGHEIVIGELIVDRSLNPTWDLLNVVVENADWAGEAPLFKASRLHAAIELRNLFKGALTITELTAQKVELNVVKDAIGRGNWQLPDKVGASKASENTLSMTDMIGKSEPADAADTINTAATTATSDTTGSTETANPSSPISKPRWLELGLMHLLVENAQVHYLDERTSREHDIELTHLMLGSDAYDQSRLSLEVEGSLEQLALSMSGVIELTPSGGSSQVYPLKLEGKLDDLAFNAAGTWSGSTLQPTGALDMLQPDIDLDMQIKAVDSSLLTTLFGWPMPAEWGPVDASASLVGTNGQYALHDIDARVDGNSTLNATGSIDRLMPLDGVRLDLTTSLHSLQEISVFTPSPLADIGPLEGRGELLWQDGKLSLKDARASYQGSYGTAVVTGHIGDLIHFDQVRLRADTKLPDFSALEALTHVSLPKVDGVVASANLISVKARDLYARDLKASVTKDDFVIDATGSIDALFKKGAELDLQLKSTLASLTELNDTLGFELPQAGPITITASLTGARQDIAINDVMATFSDELLTGTLQADVGYLNRMAEIEVDVNLASPSAQRLLNRLNISSSVDRPATTTARLKLTDTVIEFHDASLNIEDNRLQGDLTIHHYRDATQLKQITGELTVVNLDLIDLFSQPNEVQEDSDKVPDGRLLSDTALRFDLLAQTELDLDVSIERLRSKWLDVADASLAAHSSGGVLALGPFSGIINNGQAEFDLRIDVTNDIPDVSMQIEVNDFDLSRAGVFQGSDLIENTGGARGKLTLHGKGDSPATIMSGASGEGGLYVEDLLFKRGFLRLVSTDLIVQLIKAVNPFSQQNKETRFTCAALAFQIVDGVLTTPYGFAMDASDFSITGHGDVDLANETIDVQFSSKAKHGVGLGLGAFTHLVKLDGSLASPTLSPNESGLLGFGATVAAAVASSGLTLLAQGLWDRQQANSDECASAMGGAK